MTLLITCNFYFFLCNISHFFCTLSLLCEVFTRASFLKNTLNVPVSANLPFVILMKAAQSDRNVDRKTTEWRLVLGLIKMNKYFDFKTLPTMIHEGLHVSVVFVDIFITDTETTTTGTVYERRLHK